MPSPFFGAVSLWVGVSDEVDRGGTRKGRDHEQGRGADGREFYDQGDHCNVLQHGEVLSFPFFYGGFAALGSVDVGPRSVHR